MRKRNLPALAVILISTPVCLLIAIGFALSVFVGGSTGGTLSSGRSVMAHSNGLRLSSTLAKDTATISTAGRTIVVKPKTLLVDGVPVGTIDEAVKDVKIEVQYGQIRFLADGKVVATTQR